MGTGRATAEERALGGRGNVSDDKCCGNTKQDKGGKNIHVAGDASKKPNSSCLVSSCSDWQGAQNRISFSPLEKHNFVPKFWALRRGQDQPL